MKRSLLFCITCLLCVSVYAQEPVKPKQISQPANTIIAGIGCGKIILNASKESVEDVLGPSDLKSEFRSFHKNSGIYITLTDDKAREISFETSIGEYKHNQVCSPDKNLKWGASKENVIKAYGNSYKNRAKSESYGGETLISIIYKDIEFSFANDKLVRISVYLENNRLKSFE